MLLSFGLGGALMTPLRKEDVSESFYGPAFIKLRSLVFCCGGPEACLASPRRRSSANLHGAAWKTFLSMRRARSARAERLSRIIKLSMIYRRRATPEDTTFGGSSRPRYRISPRFASAFVHDRVAESAQVPTDSWAKCMGVSGNHKLPCSKRFVGDRLLAGNRHKGPQYGRVDRLGDDMYQTVHE